MGKPTRAAARITIVAARGDRLTVGAPQLNMMLPQGMDRRFDGIDSSSLAVPAANGTVSTVAQLAQIPEEEIWLAKQRARALGGPTPSM